MISRKKRILSLLLALCMTLSITGCSKKKSLFDGTILENVHVLDCDGDLIVGKYLGNYIEVRQTHPHYRDLVTGVKFAQECSARDVKNYNKIKEERLLSSYLTEEELIKISCDELTEEDINKILIRIIKSENQKKLTLTGK